MKLTWLGHSAFRIEFGSSVVLIDPFLKGNPSFTGDFATVTKGVTHILLTHGHDDHMGDTLEIAKATGAQLIANYEVCMFYAEQGIKNINPGNTGGEVSAGEFSVVFTPALHSAGVVRDGKSIYLGNPNGLILKHAHSPVLYHMGDTDIFSDLALIAELHAPEVVLIPIGDRFTMGPRTASIALRRYLRPAVALPIHYATFDMLVQDASTFVADMAGSETKILVPKVGDVLDLPA